MTGFYGHEFIELPYGGEGFPCTHLYGVLLLPGVEPPEGSTTGGKMFFVTIGIHSGSRTRDFSQQKQNPQ
jgi:hypothetical protein